MVVCLVATLSVTAANLRLTYVTDSNGARQVILTSETDPAQVMNLSGIQSEEGDQVLSALGKPMLPIESQTVEQLVTAGITTVAALINWWKNNSFTAAAVAADSYMARLKQKQ